ncbi:helix-turn-helix domain-containing protein [Paenibacillus sp. MER 180]|uniref:helix-turn-helix domain-containing protein n=1 Tax=Paenibacillus sp. MER 180 TaxID=2939570 RepID=UPI00203DC870|nr:helix-turn-helix transcriptional regulator [Paenibacillus sp. MER 180]MCM3291801.1 helix-turn-helix domain-containing protein [Paenibacillus sp. MER 180]
MFRERLKTLRRISNKNQNEVADELGINRSTYGGYESGQREPDFETLKKIAEYFKVTTDYLLGFSVSPPYIMTTLTEDEATFIKGALSVYREAKRKI